MLNPVKTLQKKLKNAKRVCVLGIGSDLLGDDCAGLLVAKDLKASFFKKRCLSVKFKAICAGAVPENCTGEVKKFKPTHLVIIDAADLKKKPGTIAIFKPEETSGVSFSTHRLPTRILANYLYKSLNCEIIVIGIQPESLRFGQAASKEVKGAVKSVTAIIKDVFKA